MSNENQTPNEIQELTEEELRDFLIQNITSFENILKDIQSTNLRTINTNVFGANDDSFVKELDEEFGQYPNSVRKRMCKQFLREHPGLRSMSRNTLYRNIVLYRRMYPNEEPKPSRKKKDE